MGKENRVDSREKAGAEVRESPNKITIFLERNLTLLRSNQMTQKTI